ncbi:MAG: hypothetical protein AAFU70_14850, partial [Planctomycetota bacterium]
MRFDVPSISAVGATAASLLIIGGFVGGVQSLEQVTLSWGERAAVAAYLVEGLAPEDIQTI